MISVSEGTCVLGVGAATPLGFSSAMSAASVRANLSRFREIKWVDKTGEPIIVSIADYLEPNLPLIDRLVELGCLSFHEAMALLQDQQFQGRRRHIPVLLGCPQPRPGFGLNEAEVFAARLIERVETEDDRFAVRLFPSGHSGALIALAEAVAMISAGVCDFVLVGGVDSYCDIDTLEWLDATGRLHSEANIDGFVPGEAAGFLLLASPHAAARCALRVVATVLSAAVTSEPHPYTSDGVCIGQGLTEAIRQSLNVPVSEDKVADWALCDLNGESFRAMEWVYAYLRTGRKHRDPLELWHPADCFGDIGAASGCVLLSIAVAAWERGYARGRRCLIWSSSDGPDRAAILVQRNDQE